MVVPFLEFTATPNCRLELRTLGQLFIRPHNKALSVVAVRIFIIRKFRVAFSKIFQNRNFSEQFG
jgi:hypothetical protein